MRRRHLRTQASAWIVASLAMLTGVLVVSAPAAAAPNNYLFTTEVVNAHSGKCLEVNGWSTSNGGNVDQWDCHGGGNQQWDAWGESGDQIHQLANQHSGLCLDVVGKRTANGSNVHQWGCQYNDQGSQSWSFLYQGAANGWHYYIITNANADVATGHPMCLDVDKWGTGNGANVQIWECNGGQNQLWRIRT